MGDRSKLFCGQMRTTDQRLCTNYIIVSFISQFAVRAWIKLKTFFLVIRDTQVVLRNHIFVANQNQPPVYTLTLERNQEFNFLKMWSLLLFILFFCGLSQVIFVLCVCGFGLMWDLKLAQSFAKQLKGNYFPPSLFMGLCCCLCPSCIQAQTEHWHKTFVIEITVR